MNRLYLPISVEHDDYIMAYNWDTLYTLHISLMNRLYLPISVEHDDYIMAYNWDSPYISSMSC
jgi:hypothetical protein